MGWASGSSLAAELWDDLKVFIPEQHHRQVARTIWDHFEGHDCDTLGECEALSRAAGYDWSNEDCLCDDECGKWGCMEPSVGTGELSKFSGKTYKWWTQACEKHKGELDGFKRNDSC